MKASELLAFGPEGPITEAGLRTNVGVALRYVASWLDGAPDLQKATVLGGSGVVDDLVAGRVQRAVLQ